MREEFARFLSEDPAGRFRMDAALAHVVEIAYRAGIEEGKAVQPTQTEPILKEE